MATLNVISSDDTKSMGAESAQANPATSFFVTSTESKTANLGGMRGADSGGGDGSTVLQQSES